MLFTQTVIVFDGGVGEQIAFVSQKIKESREKNQRVLLLATALSSEKGIKQIEEFNKDWNEPVYLLSPELKKRFDLQATPTIVTGDNKEKVFIVREFFISRASVQK